jgi:hypothetical protein
LATANDYRIYASHSVDPKKNPLAYSDKIKFMRKMFPKMGRNIIEAPEVKNILAVAGEMDKQGFTKLIVVVGSDRMTEFKTLLERYNGSDKASYNFKDGIEVVSAGDRDPDSEDATEGMSASKMRKAAAENSLIDFSKGLPSKFSDKVELFNAVRAGMGLKESYNFRRHVQLDEVSMVREAYVTGKIFKVGDTVELVESASKCVVLSRGANYITVKDPTGTVLRKWLSEFRVVDPA